MQTPSRPQGSPAHGEDSESNKQTNTFKLNKRKKLFLLPYSAFSTAASFNNNGNSSSGTKPVTKSS